MDLNRANFMHITAALLLLLPLSAIAQSSTVLPEPVARALVQAGIPESAVGVYVHEIGAAQPIIAVGADRALNPASSMKIVTTYAGLELLGPAYVWNTEILTEGEVGTAFYIIVTGEVKISKQGKLLNVLRTGECFGEMSFLGKRPFKRTASVAAVSDLTLIELRAESLAQATEGCRHSFNAAFLGLLVGRLESANTRMSQLLLDRKITIF